MAVDLQVKGHRVLSAVTQATLFRIVQEALNNVVRHAGVHHAIVTLDWDQLVASICVEDHGCGFDSEDPETKRGFGLSSMARQAREIGWQFNVYSQPGRGTQVIIKEETS